jgi:flagellar basal-body rod modification protein FlgD|nr:MAG: basal-body rod modification protein FlgD [Bacteroidota bacterium]
MPLQVPSLDSGPNPQVDALVQASRRTELNRDQFLKLLVTQLRNQDPTNPLKGQEFAAQLAQFSSVEQLIQLNQGIVRHFQALGLWNQSLYHLLVAGLVGKEARVQAEAVLFDGAKPATIPFSLSGHADTVAIRILDASGRTVRTLELGARPEGMQEVLWDGMDDQGRQLPKGLYRVRIEAHNAGQSVSAAVFLLGPITRVQYTAEGTKIWIGDIAVDLSAIEEIRQPQQQGG